MSQSDDSVCNISSDRRWKTTVDKIQSSHDSPDFKYMYVSFIWVIGQNNTNVRANGGAEFEKQLMREKKKEINHEYSLVFDFAAEQSSI